MSSAHNISAVANPFRSRRISLAYDDCATHSDFGASGGRGPGERAGRVLDIASDGACAFDAYDHRPDGNVSRARRRTCSAPDGRTDQWAGGQLAEHPGERRLRGRRRLLCGYRRRRSTAARCTAWTRGRAGISLSGGAARRDHARARGSKDQIRSACARFGQSRFFGADV